MNIERYVKETFIDSSGITVTLIDGSKHLLTSDSMTGLILKQYIRDNFLLKRGDKLIRKSDGKSFTYSSESDDIGYFHVEEMCVPVKLSDFEKEEE